MLPLSHIIKWFVLELVLVFLVFGLLVVVVTVILGVAVIKVFGDTSITG